MTNGLNRGSYSHNYLAYVALLIPLFSALRLAKFNIDTRQIDGFIGLPTPANALFFISIPIMLNFQPTDMDEHFFSTKNSFSKLMYSNELPINSGNPAIIN